jgi:DNA polymerase-3 subunit alpha
MPIDSSFIHLRLHTAYSICEGAVKISHLTSLCKEREIPACAITDTNNMFGVLDFSIQCSSNGIQPIVGCQIDMQYKDVYAPIVVIAKNKTGYQNILKLMTCFYNHHPVTFENLKTYNEGVIVLSGGYKGPAGMLYLQNLQTIAVEFLNDLHSIFKDNLYIEISRTFVEEENRTEDFFVKYAMDNNVPLVATNEVFFLTKDMHATQDILMCISEGTYVSQTDRRKVSAHCYVKTTEEMFSLFKDIPEAVINTSVIAKRCSFMPEPRAPMLPRFNDGTNRSEEEILKKHAQEGLQRRIDAEVMLYEENHAKKREEIEKEYTERLEYEYEVIKNMGFCGYFLIVSDFVQWARNNEIPVGPGRGSGAGSVVGWSLCITDLDPIKYSLIFERFLNPDRVSMPDFDIDFCQDRRDEVIEYVKEKYGKDKVAHIIALGTLQARVVLRDVGRVIQMPFLKVDRICKLIPVNPSYPVDLEKALEIEPTLPNMMKEDESVNFLIQTGLQLEGLYRHASVHAAGVVISSEPIDEVVPIYNDGESDIAITQFNLKFIEKAGLVKFDFLGLKTLTIVKQASDLAGIDICRISLEDEKTFKLLQEVNVIGVFQLESIGMRDVIQELKPDRLEDLIALISLYRPGPMDDIPKYLARKHKKEDVTYLHPCLESILSNTYGVMVYQEQVMKIAQVMGGYTLAASDLLRRAMGKKKASEMMQHRKTFVDGAKKNGVNEEIAKIIFSQMEKFAGYGFNRSHAAPYALISYQTAYLKANYMHEFYVATLNLDITNTDKIAMYVQDARANGIKILPPDINLSLAEFKKEGEYIRYALGAMKGSSITASKEIILEREKNGKFKDIQDFFNRMDKKFVNKRQMETLIMAGAFDCINSNRKQVLAYSSKLSSRPEPSSTIQKSLFSTEVCINKVDMDNIQEWPLMEKLEKERSAIGFYLSSHPMDVYSQFLGRFCITRSNDFAKITNARITIAGVLISKKEKLSKNAQKYAFINISDQDNTFEVTVMPDVFKQTSGMLVPGRTLILEVSIKKINETTRTIANTIQDIETILNKQKIYLELSKDADVETLDKLIQSIEEGDNPISFIVHNKNSARKSEIDTKYKKHISIEIRRKFQNIKGVKFYEPTRNNNFR